MAEGESAEGEGHFSFIPVEEQGGGPLDDKALQDKLRQWGLHMVLRKFHYVGSFDSGAVDAFAADFLSSPAVQEALKEEAAKAGDPKSPLLQLSGSVERAHTERLAVTKTRLDMFDKLKEEGLISEGGYVQRCFEDVYDGVTVGDAVREMLVNECSENEHVFDEDEKREFLFHVFRRVAVGGYMNQWEEVIQPYLDATKALYKSIVSVYRGRRSGAIEVASLAFQVLGADGVRLFPAEENNSFAYLVVDPRNRRVAFWYHAYTPWCTGDL